MASPNPNRPSSDFDPEDDPEDPKLAASRRVFFADAESSAQGGKLKRQLSNLSIASHKSATSSLGARRRSIDPSIALPVQYRTVSYAIDDTRTQTLTTEYSAGIPYPPKKTKTTKKDKQVTDKAAEFAETDHHSIDLNVLLTRFSTSIDQGLSDAQVARKLQEYGKNVPSKPPSQFLRKFVGYAFGDFGLILLIGSILVGICWKPLGNPPAPANLALAIVIFVVYIVQAAMNWWTDFSTSRVMASITNMIPGECLVRRNGVQKSIEATELVPGDVVFVKAGTKVPADVRFVEVSSDAKFDRAVLTGESVPVPGTLACTDKNILETNNIGLQGTHCISGSAIAICVATGPRTVFGRIAQLAAAPNTERTTLQKEILRFVIIIVGLMIISNLVVIGLWAGWIRKDYPAWISVPVLIVNIVSVAIAFVPEGLPIAVVACSSIVSNIMRKNKILCKSLKTVETLGAVSVICSDKTGTLTKNKMFVTECSVGGERFSVEDALARNIREEKRNSEEGGATVKGTALNQLATVAGLCNAGEWDAVTMNLPLHERKINGDATDQAVLRFSETLGNVNDLRSHWRKEFELAFNSKNKYMIRLMSVLNKSALRTALPSFEASNFADNDMVLLIKGAPDVLLPRCDFFTATDGTTTPLDPITRESIEDIKNTWSGEGKRVILIARKVLKRTSILSDLTSNAIEPEITDHALTSLCLVGLVGIVDPPRDDIPYVVKTLRRAGIRIFMVTGDFKLTAQAIARECGIITVDDKLIDDIDSLNVDIDLDLEKKSAPATARDIDADPPRTKAIVLSGPEMQSMTPAQWKRLCTYTEIVFARTTPEQKIRIVQEFQSDGNTVAMTGDGVNDAAALKKANIGIAMGGGSDIAIEAADMVLLENFSAVVQAVMYGRVIYDNLKKTIIYLLPAGSFAEFWPIMTSVIFGIPQILSSFLMIIICCGTDCAAAITLAYEAPEADVLLRPPRDLKKDRLVDWKLVLQAYGFIGIPEALTSFAMAFWYLQRNGIPFSSLWLGFGRPVEGQTPEYVAAKLAEASSIYFVNLVVMQFFVLMAIRTRRLSIFQHPPLFNKATQNIWLFPAMGFALLVAFFFNYTPPLRTVLLTGDVPAEHWFLPCAFGLAILMLDEGRKYVARTYPKGFVARISW